MTVLMYAVTDAPDVLDVAGGDHLGLDTRPLRALVHGHLGAVVSDHDAPVNPDHSSLWSYERVVEELMRAGTILPARFGTTAETDDEIRAMLADRERELTRSLEQVRGAVEFAVRGPDAPALETDDDAVESERPGTAYLRRRLAQEQEGRRLAGLVDDLAGDLVRETERSALRPLAALVDRRDVPEFTARLRAGRLILTGPWPPYSFVNAVP